MRKIIVIAMVSLDGVMQAPGGPDEDTDGGFMYGGWTAPFASAESGAAMAKHLEPADILLGRKTYEIFAGYWPEHADSWPGINEATKYVVSTTMSSSDWQNSTFLPDIEAVKQLKQTNGEPIKVWGSSELVQSLLEHDLVDELWLITYPVTLGSGKRLFGHGTRSLTFALTDSTVTPGGVILASYRRVGEVKTGTVEA